VSAVCATCAQSLAHVAPIVSDKQGAIAISVITPVHTEHLHQTGRQFCSSKCADEIASVSSERADVPSQVRERVYVCVVRLMCMLCIVCISVCVYTSV
jgi:hypothetical protein